MNEPMTVAELIEFLKTKRQDLLVGYALYSEYCLLDRNSIHIISAGIARPDGWIHAQRSDKETVDYLMFPGN